jgi:monoamine oxidase
MNLRNFASYDVVIIGAGVAGLTAAYTLSRHSVKLVVLEARQRVGGRTLTVNGPGGLGAFDLGATWVWPQHPHVQQLAAVLGIDRFLQFETGAAVLDQGPGLPSLRFSPPAALEPAFRLVGGAQRLAERMAEQLPPGCLQLNRPVQKVELIEQGLRITAVDEQGEGRLYQAQFVIVTLPPRLAQHSLQFVPPLPAPLQQVMAETPTWMGQAMKVLAVYQRPFWRAQGLSGLGLSRFGPVDEFRDATTGDGHYPALFGWIGDDSPARRFSPAERQAAVVEQLGRMFGPEAGELHYYTELNWSDEPYTTASPYPAAQAEQPAYGQPLLQVRAMAGRLYWAGAETSPFSGGYLDGAVWSGQDRARKILEQLLNTAPAIDL